MGRQYGISGDAGRGQCQRYAAVGHSIPAAVLSVFCQGGVSYTIHDLLCAGVSGNVSVGKGEHGEQYSGGDSRGMFLCAALISGLRSFGIRHSFGGICLSVSVETEKNPSRIDVYVTVRPDQPPGVYRLCGAGIVAFGDVKAVNDLSFRVKKGELFAFLGVNGAGKSTTISIICGQLRKDSGNVWIKDKEADRAGSETKRLLGVVFQDSVLDKPLTVKENLKSRAALYGITGNSFEKRLAELVEILDFGDYINRPVGKLSGGQRRRIDIARALIHRPEILILDEPTTGLDPQTRLLIWNVIERLRTEENMTVFLTTHYMEEAASAGYIVILDKGSIVAEGTPLELKNEYVHDTISLYGVTEDEIKALETEYKAIRDGYRIQVKNTLEATKMIVKHQEIFRDYEVVKGGMDDVFLAVTGKILGGGQ